MTAPGLVCGPCGTELPPNAKSYNESAVPELPGQAGTAMLAAPRLSCSSYDLGDLRLRMSRRGADEVSGSPELQRRMRPAGPAQMSADQRDKLITALVKKGYSHSVIAARLGMSRRGIGMALQRISEGRRGRVRGE